MLPSRTSNDSGSESFSSLEVSSSNSGTREHNLAHLEGFPLTYTWLVPDSYWLDLMSSHETDKAIPSVPLPILL